MATVMAPTPHRAAVALLAATVMAEIGWLLSRPYLHGMALWPPLVGVVGCHLALVECERRRPSLGAGRILTAVGLVVAVAVALPVTGSQDLYSYAFSGRMVAFHHANPYLTSAGHFAHDPLLTTVAHAWRSGETVYGPVFTLVSALGALAFGTSPLLARLFFQSLDAVALVGGLAFLVHRKVATHVLVFLGLAPAIVAVVNGGHNDLLAGVLLMVGVFLLRDRRALIAGTVLAAAVLVKLLIVPGVACLLVATVIDRRSRDAWRAGLVIALSTLVAYLCVGGAAALRPLSTSDQAVSRASLWDGVGDLAGDWHHSAVIADPTLAHLGSLAVFGLGLVFVTRLRRGGDLGAAAVGALLILLLATQYVLPWYSALVLPAAAMLSPRARAIAYTQSTMLLLAYVVPPGRPIHGVPLLAGVSNVVPWLQALLLLVVLSGVPLRSWRAEGRGRSPSLA